MEQSALLFPSEGASLRASWPVWELKVNDLLEAATATEHGLLGFALSETAFAALTDGEAHEPLPDPGPLGANPSVAQTAAHKYLREQFNDQQGALKTAKTKILASLNDEALGHITEPIHGTRRRTIRQILDILRTQYGTLTAVDLTTQKQLLLVPFPPATPIRAYIQRHRAVHDVCAAAGQPMPASDMVGHLRKGVKHVPTFASAVQHFVTMYPLVAQQTFELLATLLGQAEDNGEPEPTTGSVGYSAAVTEASEAFSLASVTQLITEAVSKAMREQQKDTRSKPKTTTTAARHYCWTHGPGGHPSEDCNQPAKGHVRTANNTNRQGGASINPRYKK